MELEAGCCGLWSWSRPSLVVLTAGQVVRVSVPPLRTVRWTPVNAQPQICPSTRADCGNSCKEVFENIIHSYK